MNRIANVIRSRIGPPPLERAELSGHTVTLCHGTRGRQADKDEGWLYALITNCRSFFDVGCNCGLYSVLACVTDPARKAVAFDANPEALAITARNLFLNGISGQVRFVLGFVGAKADEEVDFYALGAGGAGSRYPSQSRTKARRIKTTTLDLAAEHCGVIPDLVKIDVEGAESEVLEGARNLAATHRPAFFVEMHSQSRLPMRENGEKVLAWCADLGYDAFYLKRHLQVTTPEPFAQRGRCHLYLMPEGQEYPAYLKGIQQGDSMDAVATLQANPPKRTANAETDVDGEQLS